MSSWHTYPIFVYGTLKRNEPNHGLIENQKNGHSSFIGTAITVDSWPLVIDTPYGIPFLLDQPGCGQKVLGELFNVDAAMLAKLDELEDHPEVYTRSVIEVELVNDQQTNSTSLNDVASRSRKVQCEAYLLKNFKRSMLELAFISDYHSSDAPISYVTASARSQPFKTHGLGLVKDTEHIKAGV